MKGMNEQVKEIRFVHGYEGHDGRCPRCYTVGRVKELTIDGPLGSRPSRHDNQ